MTTFQTTPSGTTVTPVPPDAPRSRWTWGRITTVAIAVLSLASSAAMFVGAIVLGHVDHDHRDGRYLTSDATTLETSGNALAIEKVDLDGLHGDWLLGDVRLRVAATDPDDPVFVGIATKEDAAEYLSGVAHSTVDEISDSDAHYTDHPGGAPSVRPADADIWVAQSTGSQSQDLTWTPTHGSWTVVVMNADGSDDVRVTGDVGATLPLLKSTIHGLEVGGLFAAIVGLGLAGALGVRLVREPSRG